MCVSTPSRHAACNALGRSHACLTRRCLQDVQLCLMIRSCLNIFPLSKPLSKKATASANGVTSNRC